MRGKIISLSIIGLLASLLSACNFFSISKTPLSQQELCTKMKREAIATATNPNTEADVATAEQRARIQQQMRANNCG